ncbi:MAG TPA: ATP-binding protein [Pyrinomonadaceae bacterium]|nr:ATP-binding protein [Pyrinomonadaceae bacterium]
MSANRGDKNTRRILGRVEPDEFVGRGAELERLVHHPHAAGAGRGLLLLMSPVAGVSELLRQAYDQLFNQRKDIVPILFSFTRNETTAVSAAIEFLNTFLLQYVAYSRDEPTLTGASLTLSDLAELAPAADLDWIGELIAAFERERFNKDDRALVKFCFSAPQRVPLQHARPFVMMDAAQFVEHFNGDGRFGAEILRTLSRSNLPFAVAGLRRQMLAAAHRANCDFAALDIVRLGPLEDEDATRLVEQLAIRQQVRITDETRDLMLQQFAATPFLITTLLQAARERNLALDTYVAAEQLYVDELMGGRIGRHFAALLEEIAPHPETRRSLLRLLFESDGAKSSFGAWRKRLEIEPTELERMLHGLHVHEFVNWDGAMVEVLAGPPCWSDYLQARFRLEINAEPRALVVAELLANVLKRAPQAMARHYRRSTRLKLRELLENFDCQSVPEILFHCQAFSAKYKGAEIVQIARGLESETNLIKLPQVIHVATAQSFAPQLKEVCDEERCVVAHAFDDATYADAQEIVWLVAEIDSKLEAGKELAEEWCGRLESVAAKNGFGQTRIWLIANEGFTDEAVNALNRRQAYGSSLQQLELLTAHLNIAPAKPKAATDSDEFVMILPMGEDNELVAASTVEQIARRLNFRPEAINQIKTAIVEACINAAEHSFSPDRKIYQRFRVESDKLTITIASRGVTPANISAAAADEATRERRGWGLKLIRTLMDEVEFETVDDGTSLRMTKYVRQ